MEEFSTVEGAVSSRNGRGSRGIAFFKVIDG